MYDAEKKELHLPGAVYIAQRPVRLGPMTIRGQGALLAPAFVLKGGIRKADPSAMLSLVAMNGPIVIDTSETIEAGLMAVNHQKNGRIIVTRALNLLGSLAVDHLNSHCWPDGANHRIRYDRSFRVDAPVFRLFLSPWILFHREVFDS